jgi:hypothetical protein
MEVSPTLISNVTEAVLADVKAWQSRPLEPVYPILYFDALFVKSRQEGPVKNKAAYLALGVNLQGEKGCRSFFDQYNNKLRMLFGVERTMCQLMAERGLSVDNGSVINTSHPGGPLWRSILT